MTRCENKVDVIVPDSPLLLSLIYNKDRTRLGEESDKLSDVIKQTFSDAGCQMKEQNGDVFGYDSIVSDVLLALANENKL